MITVQAIQRVDVQLGDTEERRVVVQFLCRLFNLPQGAFVHEDKVCYMVEQGGHNNNIEREVWEDNSVPTPLTEAAIAVLTHIRKVGRP